MNRFLNVLCGACAGALIGNTPPSAAQPNDPSGFGAAIPILDTSVLFAIGAIEAEQAIRGSFGWPTFQEGFVDGVYFRFDPDGYARFSPSPRLDEDVFEVLCAEASTVCVAKKGIMEAGLTPEGRVQVKLSGITAQDSFSVSDRKSELPLPPYVLEPLDNRLETLLSSGGDLLIKRELETLQKISLIGFSAVSTYLRWVSQGQSPRVFPRGWPVPAQSNIHRTVGLTQPNQWVSNNAPQQVQTTWHSLGQQSYQNQQQPAEPNSGNLQVFQQPQVQDFNQLQNQQSNRTFQTQTYQQANTPQQFRHSINEQDINDFRAAFAQQAQGRNLPESPGVLGVPALVDPAYNSTLQAAYRKTDLLAHGAQQPMPSDWSSDPSFAELLAKVSGVEENIRQMHSQLAQVLAMLPQAGQVGLNPNRLEMRSSLGGTPQAGFGVNLGAIPETSQQTLEANLLKRLTKMSEPTKLNRDIRGVNLDRGLVEEILQELDSSQPQLSQQPIQLETKASDDFVTLSDYISGILSKEGLDTDK